MRGMEPIGRILVIDDNADIHADFRKILAPPDERSTELDRLRAAVLGKTEVAPRGPTFTVDWAQQGEEGLAMIKAAIARGEPYMTAFVDMRMPPGWDGLRTMKETWNIDTNLQLVLCTAYSDHPWKEIEALAGETDRLLVLKKPFDAIEVRQLAATLTAKWRLAKLAEQNTSHLARHAGELEQLRKRDKLHLEELDLAVRQRTAELRRTATHDDLTGLPNRALFHDRLSQALAHIRRNGSYKVAVLFLDVDRFKVVNDSLGHEAGDRLLKTISERLCGVLRSTDPVCQTGNPREDTPSGSSAARIGGDEFCLLLRGLKRREDAALVAQRILRALEAPYALEGRGVHSTVSIGIAISDAGEESAEEMIRDADNAMYRAKASGRGRCVVFDASMHEAVMERLTVENELRRAIEQMELRTYYQPVVSLATGEIVGSEALIRWQHPTRGLIPPAGFIGIAEETGIIKDLGLWILEDACRQLARWKRQIPGASALTVSVNVSGLQFEDPRLIPHIQGILRSTQLNPRSLILEITETALLNPDRHVVDALEQIRKMGIQTFLDDFGTGYSSLSMLLKFVLDGLKIDRSFVKHATGQHRYAAIIHSIMSLVDNLNMGVVAEGIESMEQVALLQAMGCDRGQGYMFSPPVKGEEMTQMILAGQRVWQSGKVFAA